MTDFTGLYIAVGVIAVFVAVILISKSAWQIQPYQQGVQTLLGSYKRILNPGIHFVSPIAVVTVVDLRTQVLEVPRQEVITKDNSPTNVDAIIYIKVSDAPRAIFQVQDYHVATVALAQTTLRSIIGDMELDEVLYNRERINTRLRDILDEATDRWGVRVEAVEIKEVDPVGTVKAAMEEQTSAERQRRAAVLRADGEKRSAILVAEGQKRSRILQAEGSRQSQILEAEGSRVATILEAQGESQRLRILALGASSLDAKSLTVLSLDTMASVANGQATKIVFPFEFSRLVEGASEYLGSGRTLPEHTLSNFEELQKQIGPVDDVLGTIPKQTELLNEIQSIEQEIKADADVPVDQIATSPEADLPVPPKSSTPAGPRQPIFTPSPTANTSPPSDPTADPMAPSKKRPPST